MRVIAGSLKGRTFATPREAGTRPVLSRLRRSLFDALGPRIKDARFLDLYGGSGAFSYEAISRGARSAVVVEYAKPALAAIRKNVERLEITGKIEIMAVAVQTALPRLHARGDTFELIGVCPPYFKQLQALTCRLLTKHPVFAEKATIFVQHHKNEALEHGFEGLTFIGTRQYGSTAFTMFEA